MLTFFFAPQARIQLIFTLHLCGLECFGSSGLVSHPILQKPGLQIPIQPTNCPLRFILIAGLDWCFGDEVVSKWEAARCCAPNTRTTPGSPPRPGCWSPCWAPAGRWLPATAAPPLTCLAAEAQGRPLCQKWVAGSVSSLA